MIVRLAVKSLRKHEKNGNCIGVYQYSAGYRFQTLFCLAAEAIEA